MTFSARKLLYRSLLTLIILFGGLFFSAQTLDTAYAQANPDCQPVDFVFVLDASGSMYWKMNDAKTAMYGMLDALRDSGADVRMAVVGIKDQAKIYSELVPIKTDYANLRTAIAKIDHHTSTDFGSCIGCGIKAANDRLIPSTRKKRVILLTDGETNRGWSPTGLGDSTNNDRWIFKQIHDQMIRFANEGKAAGISYYVVSMSDYSKTDVREHGRTILAVSGPTPGGYVYRNTTQWANEFRNIANANICHLTSVMGRVAEIDPTSRAINKIWATSPVCGASYGVEPQLKIQSTRLGSPNVIGSGLVNYCNPLPYYSFGSVPSAQRILEAQNIPVGYACDSWSYSIYNKINAQWELKGTGPGCTTTQLNTIALSQTTGGPLHPVQIYDNSHHVWFFIKKVDQPTLPPRITITDTPPTEVPTGTPVPTLTSVPATPTDSPTACIAPVDIMLVVDRSGSMTTGSPSKLTSAKRAAQDFIVQMKLTDAVKNNLVRIGFTSFGRRLDTTRGTTIPMTDKLDDVHRQLASIVKQESGSCFECGLSVANTELAKPRPYEQAARKVVILLGDGRANHTIATGKNYVDYKIGGAAAIAVADAGREKGYRYFVVGFDSREDKEEKWVNEGIADLYRFQNDVNKWDDVLREFKSYVCNASLEAMPKVK